MTCRTGRRPLLIAVATAVLTATLASPELFAQPPAPAQPATAATPTPGQVGPPVTMTGCVKRVERFDTDNATVVDVMSRPMTAYVLAPSGAKADDQRRIIGLIAANQGVALEKRVGEAVEVSGTLRPPMAIGAPKPKKGADTLDVTELQPMIVRTLKPASAQCK